MRFLVIVDVQNDLIDGIMSNPETKKIVQNIKKKLEDYQSEDTLVIFTKDTHYDNYSYTREGKFFLPHCIRDTPGWSLNKEISSIVDTGSFYTYHSVNVVKSRVLKSTYGSDELFTIFKNWEITKRITPQDTIEIMGVYTDAAVLANAVLLRTACPEIPMVINEDCCAGTNVESHNNALEIMSGMDIVVYKEME